jgi:hypothetical protein
LRTPIDTSILIPSISLSPQSLTDYDNTSLNPIVQPTFTPIKTRSKTGHSRPKSFPDYKLFYNTRHPLQAFSTILDIPEPTSYTQAVSDPQWRVVMGKEFDALMENRTWSLCPRPSNKHIVRNKWVYKI